VRSDRGFTLIELLVVVAIVGMLLAMAVVEYRSVRIRGGEAAAIGTLDTINRAQFAYMQACGNQRYAPTIVSLGVPVPGSGAAFLSPDLSQSDPLVKAGYRFQMSGTVLPDAPPSCTGADAVSGYALTADPLRPGITGGRYFGTNADRVIFEDAASFAGNMPEAGAPGHGQEIK
jgi:prepilin-type N-terminal cleavage/methylation domain-containing protein